LADKRKPPRAASDDKADQQFDDFLRRQFAALKRELEPHSQAYKKGKVLAFSTPGAKGVNRSAWKYGIAAAVLVAVAVPMVIQLNQHKIEDRQKAEEPLTSTDQEAPPTKKREEKTDTAKHKYAPLPKHVPQAKSDKNLPANDKTPARKKSAIAEAELANASDVDELALRAVKKEEEKDSSLAETTMAAKAAPAPQADDARAGGAAPSGYTERVAMARAESASAPSAAPAAAPTTRSIRIENGKERMKRQEINEDAEKQEMEKLWKEFEKNPKLFAKDQKRRTRLKVLLVRYNQKSRSNKLANVVRETNP